jgi:hypothetical protein
MKQLAKTPKKIDTWHDTPPDYRFVQAKSYASMNLVSLLSEEELCLSLSQNNYCGMVYAPMKHLKDASQYYRLS